MAQLFRSDSAPRVSYLYFIQSLGQCQLMWFRHKKTSEPRCCSLQQNTSLHLEVTKTILYICMIVFLSEVSCHILYLNESRFQILKQRSYRRPYYRRKLDTHITTTRMTESAKWQAHQEHQHYVSAFLLGS
jgi:hypothetical protein